MIVKNTQKLEDISVSGITCNKAEAKITICGVQDKPGVAAEIFTQISKAGVMVDTIVQNVGYARQTDISFTVLKTDLAKALKATTVIAEKLKTGDVLHDKNIARISIVGSGMRSHRGVAAKMFQTLAEHEVNIEMITTSDISVSCIINQAQAEKAVKALHKVFNLEG